MIEFKIKGKTVAKERPRFGMYGNVYTPQKTKDFEELVKWSYLSTTHQKYINCPVSVEIIVYIKQPLHNKQLFPIKRSGDIDNQVKSILDGLNKVAYNDDSQVIDLNVKKRYATENYALVKLKEVKGDLCN